MTLWEIIDCSTGEILGTYQQKKTASIRCRLHNIPIYNDLVKGPLWVVHRTRV